MNGFTIKIPATSANLGPGFDSIGIALSKRVILNCQPANKWGFTIPEKDQAYIPSDTTNLVYKTALYTANLYEVATLPPYHVTLTNEVPVARGLGALQQL
ncbi:hypothetical protein MUN89_06990 [Halobacillus salinarum]|uniref:Homoserine kinase n=1 Tax=Halobacillus salinarum TaxID=2932257 RepID=A0ABY4ENE9_9BACI|nr:hypothetical protein [Halobacillus salinarum]UOQ45673.1 hypothetical protein MUN89_06990 [Halobacillus salinarum]